MARSVKAHNRIDTKDRLKLASQKKPYWQRLEPGLFAGYHRPLKGGSGTWWSRVLVEGKYREKALGIADDHDEANGETVLSWSQAQAAVRAWAAKQTASGPLTIKQACADYIANLRADKGAAAARDAEGRLNRRLIPVLGDVLLADLTEKQLRDWRNRLVRVAQDAADEDAIDDERRSRDTANRLLSIAKAAFNKSSVKDGSEWRAVKPFENVGEARKVILTDDEQQRFIDACGPDLRNFALLVAWTGARPGKELTEARVRDFDREQRTLTVKSRKGRGGKLRSREIHLDDQAFRLLRGLASGKRPADSLLTTDSGGPWTKSLHQRPVAATVRKAGLDPDTTLYAFRHSYISASLKRGTPVGAVAEHCGTSIAMIQRYYAKYIPGDLAKYAQQSAPKLRYAPAAKITRLGSAA